MPLGMFDPVPEVVATFEDGSTRTLFSFYPDEVAFQASEFTELTEEESPRPLPTQGHGLPPVVKQHARQNIHQSR